MVHRETNASIATAVVNRTSKLEVAEIMHLLHSLILDLTGDLVGRS